jgi:peptidoglycan/LPS O-acetylase OafA/YrhL
VLGHSGFFFSGGFIGVDVFFVISGFLITRLIVAGYDTGTLTLKQFWLRRIRRILPAAAVMVGATLVVGIVTLLPRELAGLGESAIAQQTFLANMYFWAQGGYFDLPSEHKPLLHTWSLAVEEQFYLIWPLILLLVWRWGKKAIAVTIGTIAVLSFVGSEVMTRTYPSAAFYFMPPRMWELLLGAGVLFCPSLRRRPLLGLTGLALIVASAMAYTSRTPFPGLWALAPCLGTALIILAPATNRLSVTGLLSTTPVVYVGKASYSIYLWHWPLLVFSRMFSMKEELSLAGQTGLVLASVAIGSLSYEFVETPIRSRRWLPDSKRLLVSCTTVAIVLCATACVMVSYLNARYPEVAMTTTIQLKSKSKSPIGMEPPKSNCSHLGCDGPPSFVLWGDSHAMMIASLCDELARSRGLSGQCLAAGGISPLLGAWNNYPPKPEIQLDWNRRVVAWIQKNNVPNVIIVARWEMVVPSPQNRPLNFVMLDEHSPRGQLPPQPADRLHVTNEDSRRVLQEHFGQTISALELPGRRIWFLMQLPVEDDAPGGPWRKGVTRKAYVTQQYEINRVLKSCTCPMLSVVGPGKDWFGQDGLSFMGDGDGSYYIDWNHVSSKGAKKLLRPLLEPVFDRIVRDTRHLKEL